MAKLLRLITPLHQKTARNYLARMTDNKVKCMQVARKHGKDFWDGSRRYGYGGYRYDGRWKAVAKKLVKIYGLRPDASILDVGCGKGFLLYELKKLLPQSRVAGFDISRYAIGRAPQEIKKSLFVHKAQEPYPFKDKEFDLVISFITLHNLLVYELKPALQEIERVGRKKFITLESYRSEKELFSLQCWALTCRSFFAPQEWIWLFKEFGYRGDYEFIYFK